MTRWLAAALAALPVLAHADDVRLPPVYRTVLPNGMRLVVAEDHELPLVAITAFIGAGTAQDPPDQLGVAQLTADTLLRALATPFAADTVGDDRRTARLSIVSRVAPDARCLEALDEAEPNVPWRADLLGLRLRCYAAAAPERAAAARRDLARYLESEPRPLAAGVESR